MKMTSRKSVFFSSLMLFGVTTISSALGDGVPAGYEQVPFLQANGNCQIKTGITPACTDKVEMQFRPAAVNTVQTLWCSRTGSGATSAQFTAFLLNSAKVRFDRGDGGANVGQITSTGTLLATTNYLVAADYATLEGVVTNIADNTEAVRVTMASGTYTPGSELCLLASHTTDPDTGLGNYASYALYSFKLRDSGGNLRCDLVPARRTVDGVLGLYDAVRDTFLTNSQSGCFTTSGMTITPSDPEWGKALTIADNITIDAASGATWAG
ncbi:MAG: hypothetical protein J5985_09710, partial [Kiritimatiellae bacterium]|nr:hypothetical protein [Kiritimatiellia bacterium]